MIGVRHVQGPLWALYSTRYSPALYRHTKVHYDPVHQRGLGTPGLRWDPVSRSWVGYRDAVAAAVERMCAEGLVIDGDVIPTYSIVDDVSIPINNAGLWDFQKDGVRWLVGHAQEGCILAWDMGLGKTRTTLRAIRALRVPALIVCPSFVTDVWVKEAAAVVKDLHPIVLQGTRPGSLPTSPDKYPVYVCGYAIAHAWAPFLQPVIRTLVLDEIHMLQGRDARRTKAVTTLARAATYRWGLSGTPMTNRPKDLHLLSDILSEGRFGKFWDFGVVYCGGHQENVAKDRDVWVFKGRSNEDELRYRLSFFMDRKTKADVALELPPKRRQIIHVDVKKKMPRPTAANGKLSDRDVRSALDVAADAKLPQVAEMALGDVDGGSRVVVFTYRRAVAEELAASFIDAGKRATFIHGGLPMEKRKARLESAQRREIDILTATIDSSGVGVSMTFADVAIFAELTYEPHELLQAESRLHRPGARSPIMIKYVIANGSSDELIKRAVIDKLDSFEKIIGGKGEKLGEELRGDPQDALKRLYEAMMKG